MASTTAVANFRRKLVIFGCLSLISAGGLTDQSTRATQPDSSLTPLINPIQLNDTLPTPAGAPFLVADEFERQNSSSIGGVWTDCSSEHPDLFEPLGIYNGGVVISDPMSRRGVYDISPPCPQALREDHIYPGIGCAYVDTGFANVSVKVIWSGSHGIEEHPGSHVEGSPLLHVTPGSSRFGFGAWPSELWGVPIVFAGYIGAPGEKFEVVGTSILRDGHVSGTPRELEIRTVKTGEVTIWMDGKQLSFEGEIGLNPIQIDREMINSTTHGLAVDAHCVTPQSKIPTIKGVESIEIRAVK